jgi:hypothetical protein
MIFFYFLKNIFMISTSKRSENIKKINKKKFKILKEYGYKCIHKHDFNSGGILSLDVWLKGRRLVKGGQLTVKACVGLDLSTRSCPSNT